MKQVKNPMHLLQIAAIPLLAMAFESAIATESSNNISLAQLKAQINSLTTQMQMLRRQIENTNAESRLLSFENSKVLQSRYMSDRRGRNNSYFYRRKSKTQGV